MLHSHRAAFMGPGVRRDDYLGTDPEKCYCERVALSLMSIAMIVCVCNAIREREVRQAARNGATCPNSAYRACGRKPRCGQCFSFAREIIAAEQSAA